MAVGDGAVASGTGPSGVDPGAAAAAAGAGGAIPAAGAVPALGADGKPVAPAAPAAGATILAGGDGKSAAAAVAAVKATWPENWREDMAGGDAKELERLKRFAAPGDVYKSFREGEAKLTSGQLKNTLPENATPEQIATYRKENGIPETPDKYEVKLAKGVVIGEADKPVVNEFLKSMHAAHMPPAAVNTALNTYYDLMAKQEAAQQTADATFHDTALLDLGKEYGPELQRNLNGVSGLLGKSFPEGVAAQILAARTPDGKRLGDMPGVVKGFIALMRDAAPGHMLVPAGTTNVGKGVADRMNEIKGMMGDRSSAYWTDGGKIQAEYRDLINADQQMKGRAA